MSLEGVILSFVGKKGQNLSFLGRTRNSILVQKKGGGGYRYPWDRGKVVPISIKVVPVPTHQKRAGVGTDQSGIGTDASNSPDFFTLALLSPKFVH